MLLLCSPQGWQAMSCIVKLTFFINNIYTLPVNHSDSTGFFYFINKTTNFKN